MKKYFKIVVSVGDQPGTSGKERCKKQQVKIVLFHFQTLEKLLHNFKVIMISYQFLLNMIKFIH